MSNHGRHDFLLAELYTKQSQKKNVNFLNINNMNYEHVCYYTDIDNVRYTVQPVLKTTSE